METKTNQLEKLILDSMGVIKTLTHLPTIDELNEIDYSSIEKAYHINDIKWHKGMDFEYTDKDCLVVTFSFTPRINLSTFVNFSHMYHLKKSPYTINNVNISGVIDYSLEHDIIMKGLLVMNKQSANFFTFWDSQGGETENISPYQTTYNSSGKKKKEIIRITKTSQWHPNCQAGNVASRRWTELLYPERKTSRIMMTQFCAGNLPVLIPLIFYPEAFFRFLVKYIIDPNFESPHRRIESYNDAIKSLISTHLVYNYKKRGVKPENFRSKRDLHIYSPSCDCLLCKTMNSYNKLKVGFKFKTPFTLGKPKITGTTRDQLNAQLRVGFNITNSYAVSRFKNMLNLDSIMTNSATIYGLGNLGSRIALDFAKLPMLNIHLVDGDTVDEENILTQQHPGDYKGETKTFSIASQISKMYKGTDFQRKFNVQQHKRYFRPKISDDIVALRQTIGTTFDKILKRDYKHISRNIFNSNIVVVAVDSMEDRRRIFNFYEVIGSPTLIYKEDIKRPLYIDVSMSPNFIRIYSFYLDNEVARERYKQMISLDATEDNVCGMTSHNYMGLTVSLFIQKIIMNSSIGTDIPFMTHVTRDFEKIELHCPDVQNPSYVLQVVDNFEDEDVYREDGFTSEVLYCFYQWHNRTKARDVASKIEMLPTLANSFSMSRTILNRNVFKSANNDTDKNHHLAFHHETKGSVHYTQKYFDFFKDVNFGKLAFCQDYCRFSRARAHCMYHNECIGLEVAINRCANTAQYKMSVLSGRDMMNEMYQLFDSNTYELGDISSPEPSTITNPSEEPNLTNISFDRIRMALEEDDGYSELEEVGYHIPYTGDDEG